MPYPHSHPLLWPLPLFLARSGVRFLSILNNTTCVTHTHTWPCWLHSGWGERGHHDVMVNVVVNLSQTIGTYYSNALFTILRTHTHQSITSQCVGLIAHLQSVLASFFTHTSVSTRSNGQKRAVNDESSDSLIYWVTKTRTRRRTSDRQLSLVDSERSSITRLPEKCAIEIG